MKNAEDFGNWFANRRILLTGGAGFLGRAIERMATELGAVVTLTDIQATTIRMEVLDSQDTVDTILACEPEVIIHLAGISHINESQAGPFRAFDVNVLGTLNVMRAAVMLKEKHLYPVHVVIASSNHVYGSHPGMSARTEESPLNQMDVYGASKHCQDVLARSIGLSVHIPTVALRHVNAYGPGAADSHITSAVILSAMEGAPLVLRGDGTARKDYLYVDDVAESYLALAKHACDLSVIGRAFNAGPNGVRAVGALPLSVYEWVQAINEVLEHEGLKTQPPVVQPARQGEQSGYYEALDSRELRKCTGWWPRVSFKDGILRTLRHLQAR